MCIKDGVIGYAVGADWHLDQNIPTQTNSNGTPTGWLVNQADSAIGDTTVTIDTGSNAPVAGDIFTVAASTQQFVVASYAANVITFQPALTVALANNSAITFAASHVVNVAFQRNAFAFALAPIMASPPNSDSTPHVTDEKAGMNLSRYGMPQ